MRYSCFDEPTGSYRYFEDNTRLPINTDLPVPKLPAIAGRVGVPAREAGRPLPAQAREVGQGARPSGIIVNCRGGALSGWWSDLGQDSRRNLVLGAVALITLTTAVLLITEKEPYRSL